eukprot:m.135221 g.135221  ORF g.135221 m.135221 type:complete len:309 (+) comp20157_c1_seq1:228-1154(+)
MDSCVMRTRLDGVHLVQTTDFFYPLVDDPYVQGKIAAANVLSDMYAMGVTHCDNVLMLLALSLEMSPQQRNVVTPLMIQGFNDLCREAETTVNGGQTVLNPWMIVGGVATCVARPEDYILPELAVAGDVLVLTKPLGTQVAVNAHQWLGTAGFDRIKGVISEADVRSAYRMSMHSMARLNRNAAGLMHKYKAHGATDVTGFGFLGHAINLCKNQREEVDFVVHTLPIIKGMIAVNEKFNFKLLEGFSAETSGGLLIAMPKAAATEYIKELEVVDGVQAWIVGEVVPGSRQARLADGCSFLEVCTPELG